MRLTVGALQGVLHALFPKPCSLCDLPLVVTVPHGLCDACFECLGINNGRRCQHCDLPVHAGTLCQACSERPPAYDALRAPFVFGGGIAELVHKAKFAKQPWLCRDMAALVLADDEAAEILRKARTIVPVPLTRRRRWQRGYNQSTLLARCLARGTDATVRFALRRRRHGPAQSTLCASKRWDNAVGAFECRDRALAGPVIVVDDVVTSGATVHYACHALRERGVQKIYVLALARAVAA